MARTKQTKRLAPPCKEIAAIIAAEHGRPGHGPPTAPAGKKLKITSKKMSNVKNNVVGKAEDSEKKKSTVKGKSTGECQEESKNKGENEREDESKNWQEEEI
jgi:hypothetical protein